MIDPRFSKSSFNGSYDKHKSEAKLVGPFHRIRTPIQTVALDELQIETGMLLGDVPWRGYCPTVQAYFGPLPPGEKGIEFFTTVLPQQTGLDDRQGANWLLADTAFTGLVHHEGREFAAITIVVTRHTR